MSSSKTPNTNMNIWVPTDDVVMDEFNENFTIIDSKFSPTTGHKHSGVNGDGSKVDAVNVKISSARFTSTNLKAALEELFTDANSSIQSIAASIGYTTVSGDTMTDVTDILESGRQAILGAINERGQDLPLDSNLRQLAVKVNQVGWPEQSYGSAMPEDVADSVTFKNNDSAELILTGAAPDHGLQLLNASTIDYVIPAGYYKNGSKVLGSNEIIPEAIRKDVNLFGVVGNYDVAPGYHIGNTVEIDNLIPNRNYDTTPEWSAALPGRDVLCIDPYFYWLANTLVVMYQKTDNNWTIRQFSKTGIEMWVYEIGNNILNHWTQGSTDLFFRMYSGQLMGFNMTDHSVIIDTPMDNQDYKGIKVTSSKIVTMYGSQLSIRDYDGTYTASWQLSAYNSFRQFIYDKLNDRLYMFSTRYDGVPILNIINVEEGYYSQVHRPQDLPFINYFVDKYGYLYLNGANECTTRKINTVDVSYPTMLLKYKHTPFDLYAQDDGFYESISLPYPSRKAMIKYNFDLEVQWITEEMPEWDNRFGYYSFICDDEASFYFFDGMVSKYHTTQNGYQILGGVHDGYRIL